MAKKYKAVATVDPSGSSAVILARDESGEVTKGIGVGETAELTPAEYEAAKPYLVLEEVKEATVASRSDDSNKNSDK